MPTKRAGYVQLPFEMPEALDRAVRAAAERDGMRLTTWICVACAAAAGVEYEPPRLGRPPKGKPAQKARTGRKKTAPG